MMVAGCGGGGRGWSGACGIQALLSRLSLDGHEGGGGVVFTAETCDAEGSAQWTTVDE